MEAASVMDVIACATKMLGLYSGGLRSALFGILYEVKITADDFSKALPEFACPRKNFHEGFVMDELELLLVQPDTSAAVGKRDYAMMILALQSVLRACDMIRLTFDCIDWRTREICVVQHKTGQPLTIPLEPETGNAIADYLLNGRPKSSPAGISLSYRRSSPFEKPLRKRNRLPIHEASGDTFRPPRFSQLPPYLCHAVAAKRSAARVD